MANLPVSCSSSIAQISQLANGSTGYHAKTIEEYAAGFAKALNLSPEDTFAMRLRARQNSLRFSEDVFNSAWTAHLERLIETSRT